MAQLPLLQIITYCLALWMGSYLIARHHQNRGMVYAGLGLLAYAVGLEIDTLWVGSPQAEITLSLQSLRAWVILLPAIFWLLAIRQLVLAYRDDALPSQPRVLALTASIFFALGIALLILPQSIISTDLAVVAVGFDLLLLGYAIAGLDAYHEGESLLPDFLRSLGASTFLVSLFGIQIILVMAIEGSRFSLLFLLMMVVSTIILLQTFSEPLQRLWDRFIYPEKRQTERAQYRSIAMAVGRADDSLDVSSMDEKEFIRLTRRALSHLGDLSRLASSPLIQLPIITERLIERNQTDSTLARANELKSLLTELIEHLKPLDNGHVRTTDEWRYYNALYYPYVMGLRPYSHRTIHDDLDSETETILSWFQTMVPERTLHNWQNAAAKLIAQELRERESGV